MMNSFDRNYRQNAAQRHTFVKNPWPNTASGRGRPADMSMAGQYTA
jgi:hypothetical protein